MLHLKERDVTRNAWGLRNEEMFMTEQLLRCFRWCAFGPRFWNPVTSKFAKFIRNVDYFNMNCSLVLKTTIVNELTLIAIKMSRQFLNVLFQSFNRRQTLPTYPYQYTIISSCVFVQVDHLKTCWSRALLFLYILDICCRVFYVFKQIPELSTIRIEIISRKNDP